MKRAGIIGAGPGGLTAAIYLLRYGIGVDIYEKTGVGGQMLITDDIDNYPGFPDGISGFDLAQKMLKQAQKFNANIIYKEVKQIKEKDNKYILNEDSDEKKYDAIIVATGSRPRKLNVKGEEEYTGKGVSYCAVCDGFFYKDRIGVIVGGGNTAVEDALFLSNICKKVYLIHRRQGFRADPLLIEKLKANEKIELILDSVVEEIIGDGKKIEKVKIKNKITEEVIERQTDGIFFAVGRLPNTENFKHFIEEDENGFIKVDENFETNMKNVYAIGDCVYKKTYQIVIAASEGAIAASIIKERI